MKPKDRPHYVNNAQFSTAVVEYVTEVREAKSKEEALPVVPDYIAQCFLKIAEDFPINQTLSDIHIVKKWSWTQSKTV